MGQIVQRKNVLDIDDLVQIVDDAHTDVSAMLGWNEAEAVSYLDYQGTPEKQRAELEAALDVAQVFLPVIKYTFAMLQNTNLPARWVAQNPTALWVAELELLLDELRDALWSVKDSGVTHFISEDHFKDWLRSEYEFGEERRDLNSWPLSCIDWDVAAHEKRSKYPELELDGETYLYEEL